MIRVEKLSYTWPGATEPGLADISFSVPPGSLICLAGCNGSGKSTLLQCLAGILRPGEGTAAIRAGAGQRESALLLQDADLQILGSTVEEDLFLPWPKPSPEQRATALELARRLALEAILDAPVHTLSYGQKRKLCLAAALLAQPACLLLDEPLSGLDYPGIRELRGILAANRQAGLVQVVSTHDLEPLLDMSSHILVLHRGRQVFFGTPEAAMEQLAANPHWGLRPPCAWRHGRAIEPWDDCASSPVQGKRV